jgi:hypothetical protein
MCSCIEPYMVCVGSGYGERERGIIWVRKAPFRHLKTLLVSVAEADLMRNEFFIVIIANY